MRRGTKPQRAALKVIRGSLGTRRVPKFEPRGISILDAPPAWMDETQRAQWFYAVRQAFIMIRTAGELGFTPSARASLGMIEERGRGGPRLIDEVNPFDEFR
jgi:phage terminase small subunit